METTFEELLLDAPESVLELLEGLKGLRERPDYHPESSTYEHSKIVVTRLLDTNDSRLIMAGLFHDLFKLKCVTIKNGLPSSPGHEDEAAKFIRENKDVQDYIESKCAGERRYSGTHAEDVAILCEQHMRFKHMGQMSNKKRWALLEHRLFFKLCIFALADRMLFDWDDCWAKWNGTEAEKDGLMIGDVTYGWMRADAKKMNESKAAQAQKDNRAITGFDLIKLGYPQGKVIGLALKTVDEKFASFDAQTLLEIFAYVLRSPSNYKNDEAMGEVAKCLIDSSEKVI